MAAWQFEVALQPDRPAIGPTDPDNNRPAPVAVGLFARNDAEILREIDGIFPRRESWSEDLLVWGEEDGNRLHAVLERGMIVELTARIDLRRPPGSFPADLVALARSCGARFSTADDRPVPPDLHSLSVAVRDSDSFRFVIDPHRYLRELASQTERPRFAVCVAADGCDDLSAGMIYRALPDEAAGEGLLRIVDDSGEDDLYPARRFVVVAVPESEERKLLAVAPATVA